jgi:hypothetical protein
LFFSANNDLTNILTDTLITSFLTTLIVTIVSTNSIKRELHAGHYKENEKLSPGPLLSRLPKNGVLLGLILFLCVALILVILTISLLYLFNITNLTRESLILLMIIYSGPVAFIVARLAIIRQL